MGRIALRRSRGGAALTVEERPEGYARGLRPREGFEFASLVTRML